jgi:hypothetical protein
MTAFEILQLLNMGMKMAEAAGLNYQKLAAMRAEAKEAGRELNEHDLKLLAADAQAAINNL